MLSYYNHEIKLYLVNRFEMSYKYFADMMNIKDKIEGELYDWEITE